MPRSRNHASDALPALAPIPHFADKLLTWFDQHGRKDLPWQQNKTPYRVWVSEIMLQQTQVATVIDYYLRFMARFPTISDLAEAHEDEVLEHWAGLGYYARARNLHKTAKLVADDYQGEFPTSLEQICALPGIGRSTAGAIMSITMGKPISILDGNVKRVLSRVAAVRTWPGERKTEQQLWALSDQLTPSQRTSDYTQAIMDLGATLCTRSKPDCPRCPMLDDCQAYADGSQGQIPASKPKKAIPTKQVWMPIIAHPTLGLLLEKRPPSGIWGGLYSLPEISYEFGLDELEDAIEQEIGLKTRMAAIHKPFVHVFSHYKLEINPVAFVLSAGAEQIREQANLNWHSSAQIENLGLPAPVKNILSAPDKQAELALE